MSDDTLPASYVRATYDYAGFQVELWDNDELSIEVGDYIAFIPLYAEYDPLITVHDTKTRSDQVPCYTYFSPADAEILTATVVRSISEHTATLAAVVALGARAFVRIQHQTPRSSSARRGP